MLFYSSFNIILLPSYIQSYQTVRAHPPNSASFNHARHYNYIISRGRTEIGSVIRCRRHFDWCLSFLKGVVWAWGCSSVRTPVFSATFSCGCFIFGAARTTLRFLESVAWCSCCLISCSCRLPPSGLNRRLSSPAICSWSAGFGFVRGGLRFHGAEMLSFVPSISRQQSSICWAGISTQQSSFPGKSIDRSAVPWYSWVPFCPQILSTASLRFLSL